MYRWQLRDVAEFEAEYKSEYLLKKQSANDNDGETDGYNGELTNYDTKGEYLGYWFDEKGFMVISPADSHGGDGTDFLGSEGDLVLAEDLDAVDDVAPPLPNSEETKNSSEHFDYATSFERVFPSEVYEDRKHLTPEEMKDEILSGHDYFNIFNVASIREPRFARFMAFYRSVCMHRILLLTLYHSIPNCIPFPHL